MKQIFYLSFIFAMLVTSLSSLADQCTDLSGDYTSGTYTENGLLVWSFVQNECKSLAMGSYDLNGEIKTNIVVPRVMYVNKDQQNLCQVSKCFVFLVTSDGIEYPQNGSINVDGVHMCRYEKVSMSLLNGDLSRVYYISDTSTPTCKSLNNFQLILKRVH